VSERERERAVWMVGGRAVACDWPVSPGEGASVSAVSGAAGCLHPSGSAGVSRIPATTRASLAGCLTTHTHSASTSHTHTGRESEGVDEIEREREREIEEGGGRDDRVRQTDSEGR